MLLRTPVRDFTFKQRQREVHLEKPKLHITVSMPHSTRIGTSFCIGIVKSCWSHTSLANDSIWTKPSMRNVGVFARAYLSTSKMDKRSHWKWAATWTSFLKVCASYLIICVKSYMGNSRSFSNSKRASHGTGGVSCNFQNIKTLILIVSNKRTWKVGSMIPKNPLRRRKSSCLVELVLGLRYI